MILNLKHKSSSVPGSRSVSAASTN